MADGLLHTLILASEKASRIARLCRENNALFSLLIQEKGEKNNEIDFKTFADVFIQQIVTKEVRSKFGNVADKVQGEENNQFTNTLGESVCVEIASNVEDTTAMLSKVLDGNESAAKVLANAAHETTSLDIEEIISNEALDEISVSGLNLDRIGMWVDPIDCTSQYVKGIEDAKPTSHDVYESGLQCVLVLFGVYSLDTGEPIMGVINQPFCTCEEKNGKKRWKSRCIWGFSYNGVNRNNLGKKTQMTTNNSHSDTSYYIVLSSHDPKSMSAMKTVSASVKTCLSRGAGYKCLTVVDQLADAFVYSSNGSYKWDTCAPHAILNSCGGCMAVLDGAIKAYREAASTEQLEDLLRKQEVIYTQPEEDVPNWQANNGGLLVCSNTKESRDISHKILKALSELDE